MRKIAMMKLIGKGWQYRVYDIGNGRVRKIKRSLLDSFCRIFFMPKPAKEHRKFRFNVVLSLEEMWRISRGSDKDVSQLKKILPLIPGYLLGNPVFLDGINYEQDYAIPFFQYFQENNAEKNKEMITKYSELIVELWKYGCSDDIFNFRMNSGIDKNGRVIMIDLGELVCSKEKVGLSIKSKKWLHKPCYTLFLQDLELKNHFRQEMDRLVTFENLNQYWRSSV
jgi:hypothetical protein